jgi:hypothetical protein
MWRRLKPIARLHLNLAAESSPEVFRLAAAAANDLRDTARASRAGDDREPGRGELFESRFIGREPSCRSLFLPEDHQVRRNDRAILAKSVAQTLPRSGRSA